MQNNSIVCAVTVALTLSGCSSRPREFTPTLAVPPASTAALNAATAECNQLLVAGKLDQDGRAGSGAAGAAAGGAMAVAGGAAASSMVPAVGMALASATAPRVGSPRNRRSSAWPHRRAPRPIYVLRVDWVGFDHCIRNANLRPPPPPPPPPPPKKK